MRFLVLALLCQFAADAPPPPATDGKSLDGWVGLPDLWKAADGSIVGTSDGSIKFNTFLCSKRAFKNFEMTFQVRLKDGKGNSGVQIRSTMSDGAKFIVKGPQCDIGDKYWGSLYGEGFGGMMKASDFAALAPTLKKDGFNNYAIKVVGKRVTITVNGITTVDQEFANLPPEGIIALQLHQGPAMEVNFKGIRLKELD